MLQLDRIHFSSQAALSNSLSLSFLSLCNGDKNNPASLVTERFVVDAYKRRDSVPGMQQALSKQ